MCGNLPVILFYKMRFNFELREVLSLAKMEFRLNNHSKLEPIHLLMSVLIQPNGIGWKILEILGVNVMDLSNDIQNEYALKLDITKINSQVDMITDNYVKEILIDTTILSDELGIEMSVELLMVALIRNENLASELMKKHGVTYDNLSYLIFNNSRDEIEDKFSKIENDKKMSMSMNEELNDMSDLTVRKKSKSDTPTLNAFGTNLNELASKGELQRIIGREKELERMMIVLMRKNKSNPLLIGDPGVGKTSLAEGLAYKIVNGDVHNWFLNKTIFTVDLASMVAGTRYRGEFEERLKNLVKELKANPNIIIFLDELHTLIGSGASPGSMDGANILKPELSRGHLQVIGATTYSEYKEHISKDGAICRRFQNINLVEPTAQQTIEIIKGIRDKYEDYHEVTLTDELIEKVVKYSERYISTKKFPDKAIDVIDELSAFVNYNNGNLSDEYMEIRKELENAEKDVNNAKKKLKELISSVDFIKAAEVRDELKQLNAKARTISAKLDNELKNKTLVNKIEPTEDDVLKTIALMTGIPTEKMDDVSIDYLLKLEDKLNAKVIGQKEAVEIMCQGIIRQKTGIKDPNKPLVYLFLGQTGTGKSMLTKEIAKEVYGSESNFIRINMSDYQDSYTVSNLTGSAKGYVGSESGSFLYEKVKHNPNSIILLDEVEKAHSNVFNAFLQIFDEGQAITNDGEVISFKETIIVMTSNLGVREVAETEKSFNLYQSKENTNKQKNEAYMKALKAKFSPEILNRITKIITFNPIGEENVIKIAENETDKLVKRLSETGKTLTLKKSVFSFLAEKGFSKEYGARFLNRTIEQEIEIPLSYYILKNPGKNKISIDFKSGVIIFK